MNIIKMDLVEIGWFGVDWIVLAENGSECGNVVLGCVKCCELLSGYTVGGLLISAEPYIVS
jgi:hypothetical protein